MSPPISPAPKPGWGHVLTVWTPEDKAFWEREGKVIAKINLWISAPALLIVFAVWQVWSVVGVGYAVQGNATAYPRC